MSKDKHHRSRKEFLKYLKGEMGAKASHDFESEVLKSEFEQDALIGFDEMSPGDVDRDLKELDSQLPKAGYQWVAWAAAAVLFIVSAYLIWPIVIQNLDQGTLALKKTEEITEPISNEQVAADQMKQEPDLTLQQEPRVDTNESSVPEEVDRTTSQPQQSALENPQVQVPSQVSEVSTLAQIIPEDTQMEEEESPPLAANTVSDSSALLREQDGVEVADLLVDDDLVADPIAENKTGQVLNDSVTVALESAPEKREAPAAGLAARSAITESLAADEDIPVETMKVSPLGGEEVFNEFISDNKIYPEEARAQNISGNVRLNVTVGSSGEVTDIQIIKGLGSGCDEEATRLINEWTGGWVPAQMNGEPVEGKIEITIDFP